MQDIETVWRPTPSERDERGYQMALAVHNAAKAGQPNPYPDKPPAVELYARVLRNLSLPKPNGGWVKL